MSRSLVLAVIGLALAGVSLVGYLSTRIDTGDLDAVVAQAPSTTAVRTPEVPTPGNPSPVDRPSGPTPSWTANTDALLERLSVPLQPRSLVIPALGIDAPVGAYGLDSRGRMDVPNNVDEVGWYKFGPTPGGEGSAVLAAHVDLRSQGPGVFFDLKSLAPGSLVEVEYEDGSHAEFTVVARRSYLKEELPLDAIFARHGSPVLTLVTCGGGFSESDRSYDSNVVVFAVPSDVSADSADAS